MSRIVCALLILSVSATACWLTNDEPTKTSYVATTTTSTPHPIPTATSTPRVFDGPSAASNIPFPTAVPTSTPTPGPSPTPVPTPTDEDLAFEVAYEEFLDNFKSISYRATFNMPDDRLTVSGYLIVADVEGWVTIDPESQEFARINMTKPVERSIEVLSQSSFGVYLNDLDEGKWYFISENSDAGPLGDISHMQFLFLAFSAVTPSSLEQSPDGYVVTHEPPVPPLATITASYDQAYTLRSVVLSDTEGKETLRVRFFDLNKPHDIRPYQKGEGLPEDYLEPTK